MIVFIICASFLLLGIINFVLNYLVDHIYYKWRKIEQKYAPKLDSYHWEKTDLIYDINPKYDKEKYEKAKKKREFYGKINSDCFILFGLIGCVLGGFFSLIIGVVQIDANFSQSSRTKYLNMCETRSAYVRELENNFQNEHLYKDIANFNNELRTIKMGYENPWFSWFYNPLIANNIDYIEVEYVYDNT